MFPKHAINTFPLMKEACDSHLCALALLFEPLRVSWELLEGDHLHGAMQAS